MYDDKFLEYYTYLASVFRIKEGRKAETALGQIGHVGSTTPR